MLDRTNRSFFSRFKRRIRDEGGHDPGGRYFSIILTEAFNEAPDFVGAVLFPDSSRSTFKGAFAETEFEYLPGRFADMAIFIDRELIALVEVKEDDQLGGNNLDQVKAYLKYVTAPPTKRRMHFAYVTKHLPSSTCGHTLQQHGYKPLFYSQIYARLCDAGESSGLPIVGLFQRYLQDEGSVYTEFEKADEPAFRLMLRQAFGTIYQGTGYGREGSLQQFRRATKLLPEVAGNVEAMGIEFHNSFRSFLGNRFSTKFAFEPSWKGPVAVSKSAIKNAEDGYTRVDSELCDGGDLYVYSEGRLVSGPSVWLGLSIGLSLDDGDKLYKYVFAGIKHWKFEAYGKSLSSFPNRETAQRLSYERLSSAIKLATPKLKGEARKSANLLAKQLRTFVS